ncbi:hypothetical protein BBK36DRAFT_1207748 [Trichoderma citrinoviride]|uniref:Cyclin-D1-binding protein 1-like N-terminal domain-containing protein n=1 Tax=Trichoderma citrinoviride TaxID=58853 RepID=A0A2T4AZ51_9HYPO|nr:hypothetical protein BBK36DRAFT_1207748 [Trichoderma citrinoviride]PTB62347.1 hypothetical protein BBK36DRAFT_1207748 [Trichoderma citrinoviride]
MAPDAAALESLESLVQTACALLKQLQDVLSSIRNNPDAPPSSTTAEPSSSTAPLDALALARDSATLIRAHATKVSLLIINEPFTPSAISSVLRELVAGPIPGLVASVQACDPNGYTLVFRNELAWRCQRVLAELADLVRRIPTDGKVLKKEKEGFGGGGAAGGKGSIASTGVLWAACDKVVGLANGGVGGFFVDKMGEWKDTLSDIMEEMKEWGDEEPDDDDEDDDDDDEEDADDYGVSDLADQIGSTHISTQNILDDLMSSHRTIPAADPDRIRPRLESSLRRLRLVILLYQAITKRRMKKLPPFPPPPKQITATATTTNNNKDVAAAEGEKVPRRLDELASLLQKLPDRFGDLACAFYELRPREIDEAMDQCFLDAFAVSELLGEGWDGRRDEFTEWTDKFQREIKKA